MKTAHQLAKELLAGPDLPIVTPKIEEYSPDVDGLEYFGDINFSVMELFDSNDTDCSGEPYQALVLTC